MKCGFPPFLSSLDSHRQAQAVCFARRFLCQLSPWNMYVFYSVAAQVIQKVENRFMHIYACDPHHHSLDLSAFGP